MYPTRAHDRTRTRIVATLGPACEEPAMLDALLQAGVDVFRINASHADPDIIRDRVARVRAVCESAGLIAAVLLDLQGPKIRTGDAPTPLQLADGALLTVVCDESFVAEGTRIGTTYPALAADVRLGNRVLFSDGKLSGEVVAVRLNSTPHEVDIRLQGGGELGAHQGINLPGVDVSAPSMSDKDHADLRAGVEAGVDWVALSFVRTGDDVRALRATLRELHSDAFILAKIEKPQALENLDDILTATDAVMVARGDLGVEVPLESVPVHQKTILAAALRAGKLTVTATQMLDSMERNPRPTRAETTDVANAILDGTDAVMLSGETSIGKWPVETVRTMDAIARDAESSRFFHSGRIEDRPPLPGPAGAACRAACWAVLEAPRPILVFTWSGSSARFLAGLRPRGPIFAMSPNPRVVNALSLVWGVTSLPLPEGVDSVESMIDAGERTLLSEGLVHPGEEIVILGGNGPVEGSTNFVKFHVIGA